MTSKFGLYLTKFRVPILLCMILTIGIFARLWEFRAVPPGLNPDEASIGLEGYDIYKFGMDRNGMSYPVYLISWGSGANALYAYLAIPFIALGGLDATSIRFPMILSGILSLPLLFISSKQLLGEKFALIATFLMAISPWHIINSRWAVESNILPFFFLAGFTCLVLSAPKNNWFLVSCICFALCLYTYGTAYMGVPVFLFLTLPALFLAGRVTKRQIVLGLSIFLLFVLPILIFIAINTLRLDTLHIGMITIPRLPVQARYEAMAAIFGDTPMQSMGTNLITMSKLLWTQADAYPWNHVEPFGYFYRYTLPFTVSGLLLTIPTKFNQEYRVERWMIFSWMAASIVIGIMHPVNLTRLNLIFTPILLCIALLLFEGSKRSRGIVPVSAALLLIGFVLFTRAYHGEDYQKRASSVFNEGIIPAIDYATEKGNGAICFTEKTYSAYIYVLFTQKLNPMTYVNQLEWIDPLDPVDPARTPRSLNQYRFRIADCMQDEDAIYILTLREMPPNSEIAYKQKKFEKFLVFSPK
jgi:hypothetical protein